MLVLDVCYTCGSMSCMCQRAIDVLVCWTHVCTLDMHWCVGHRLCMLCQHVMNVLYTCLCFRHGLVCWMYVIHVVSVCSKHVGVLDTCLCACRC